MFILNPHRRGISLALIISLSLLASACTGGNKEPTPDSMVTPGSQSATATSGSTQAIGARQVGTPVAGETPAAGKEGSASKVSPTEVTLGNVKMSLTVDNAQHMADQQKPETANQAQNQNQQGSDKDKAAPSGLVVFGGMMLKVVNNFDAAQKPPADSSSGELLRSIGVQVKDKTSGQAVPYLNVSVDILRDGRPVIFDQVLVPAAPAQAGSDQLRYVNNIRLPGKANYQVFVRTTPNPLLGADALPAAQFNITFE